MAMTMGQGTQFLFPSLMIALVTGHPTPTHLWNLGFSRSHF